MRNSSTESLYLKFELRGMFYAIPLGCVREILPAATLGKPPRMPSILEGFLTLGAEVLPVIRLDRLLDLAEQDPIPESHLILFRQGKLSFIFIVDRVHDILAVQQGELHPLRDQQNLAPGFVAQIHRADMTLPVIELEKVLLEQEKRAVSEWTAHEQKRLLNLVKAAV